MLQCPVFLLPAPISLEKGEAFSSTAQKAGGKIVENIPWEGCPDGWHQTCCNEQQIGRRGAGRRPAPF